MPVSPWDLENAEVLSHWVDRWQLLGSGGLRVDHISIAGRLSLACIQIGSPAHPWTILRFLSQLSADLSHAPDELWPALAALRQHWFEGSADELVSAALSAASPEPSHD
jgi:hypothetical protein